MKGPLSGRWLPQDYWEKRTVSFGTHWKLFSEKSLFPRGPVDSSYFQRSICEQLLRRSWRVAVGNISSHKSPAWWEWNERIGRQSPLTRALEYLWSLATALKHMMLSIQKFCLCRGLWMRCDAGIFTTEWCNFDFSSKFYLFILFSYSWYHQRAIHSTHWQVKSSFIIGNTDPKVHIKYTSMHDCTWAAKNTLHLI